MSTHASDDTKAPLALRFVWLQSRVLPVLVFIFVLVVTGVVAWWNDDQVREQERIRFEQEMRVVVDAIEDRMDVYVNALRAGLGLFEASESVGREEWRIFTETMDLQNNFPGIQGFGFSEYVRPEEREAHIARLQSEGFPNFKIHPERESTEYSSIIYLEPFDERNLEAFGFDMLSEETRRRAMHAARDSGVPQLSGRVTLVQEIDEDVQAGFLIYVPFYEKTMADATVLERRAALDGYVYSPFRAGNFMSGLLGAREAEVDFAVFDGEIRGATSEQMLYDSTNGAHSFVIPDGEDDHLFGVKEIYLVNHQWTVLFRAKDGIRDSFGHTLTWIIWGIGGLIGLLLAVLIYVSSLSASYATTLARKMTADLRTRTQEKEAVNTVLKEKTQELEDKSASLNTVNRELEKRITQEENATRLLREQKAELEKMNKLMVDREVKMADLKEKADLHSQAHEAPKGTVSDKQE